MNPNEHGVRPWQADDSRDQVNALVQERVSD